MVLQAAAEHAVDLNASFLVGDKEADIECGCRAGTRTILVLTGYGSKQRCSPDFTFADVPAAVDFILAEGALT
jgi:D-glycero-D-manno-heptose 1,7-bisphosphate phosphatase